MKLGNGVSGGKFDGDPHANSKLQESFFLSARKGTCICLGWVTDKLIAQNCHMPLCVSAEAFHFVSQSQHFTLRLNPTNLP
jgi:hypothetical protein